MGKDSYTKIYTQTKIQVRGSPLSRVLQPNGGKHVTTHNITRQTHTANEGCMAPKTDGNMFSTIQVQIPG